MSKYFNFDHILAFLAEARKGVFAEEMTWTTGNLLNSQKKD